MRSVPGTHTRNRKFSIRPFIGVTTRMRSIVTRFLDYSGENVTILFFQENSHNWCSPLMFIAEVHVVDGIYRP